MEGQSKRHSLLESLLNILIGYGIAIGAQVIIFPYFGGHFTLGENLKIGALFTVVSLVRSYFLRRAFNWLMLKGWKRTQGQSAYDPKQVRYEKKRAQRMKLLGFVEVTK